MHDDRAEGPDLPANDAGTPELAGNRVLRWLRYGLWSVIVVMAIIAAGVMGFASGKSQTEKQFVPLLASLADERDEAHDQTRAALQRLEEQQRLGKVLEDERNQARDRVEIAMAEARASEKRAQAVGHEFREVREENQKLSEAIARQVAEHEALLVRQHEFAVFIERHNGEINHLRMLNDRLKARDRYLDVLLQSALANPLTRQWIVLELAKLVTQDVDIDPVAVLKPLTRGPNRLGHELAAGLLAEYHTRPWQDHGAKPLRPADMTNCPYVSPAGRAAERIEKDLLLDSLR